MRSRQFNRETKIEDWLCATLMLAAILCVLMLSVGLDRSQPPFVLSSSTSVHHTVH